MTIRDMPCINVPFYSTPMGCLNMISAKHRKTMDQKSDPARYAA